MQEDRPQAANAQIVSTDDYSTVNFKFQDNLKFDYNFDVFYIYMLYGAENNLTD